MSRFEWGLGIVLTLGLGGATLYSLTPGHPLGERIILIALLSLQCANFAREVVASRCKQQYRPVRLTRHTSRTIQTASDEHLNRTGEHHGRKTDDGEHGSGGRTYP